MKGFTEKEISEILDLNQNTVKSRLFKGRKRLKDQLTSIGKEDEIHTRTDQDIQGVKDEIWNELEKELFNEETLNKGTVRNVKKKNRAIPLIVTIAAGILIAFSLQTDTGTALMKGIKEIFVQEKAVVQNIEGMDEEMDVQLNEGTDAEYVIYVDETRYKLINGEKSDVITTVNPLPENYPEVTMEIRQVPDEKPEVLLIKSKSN